MTTTTTPTLMSSSEVRANADELAEAFEHEFASQAKMRDAAPLREIIASRQERSTATERLTASVIRARAGGVSWRLIGLALGCTGEAARQKYGKLTTTT